eukprot:TRINITY_DN9025_c0_g1_i1.p1 TRINITY_DN9025_c0_g1~~TRINITY_DN9025_c0_g1_i1.p1  ORF type:complete len:870 (+),score=190.08 TRINITY_DN9025_c0_g1_i1:66-2675(+)
MSSCCGCFSGLAAITSKKLPPLDAIIRTKDVRGAAQWAEAVRSPNGGELATALSEAARQADPNARDECGRLALVEAVRAQALDLVKELLEANAAPEEKDSKGSSAMSLARQIGRRELIEAVGRTVNKKLTADFQASLFILRKVHLFANVPPSEVPRIATAFKSMHYRKGEELCKQGDPANQFFLVVEGAAEVLVRSSGDDKPKKVAELTKNSHFGEAALVNGGLRAATVQCTQDMKACVLSRSDFLALEIKGLNLPKRKAVLQGDEPQIEVNEALKKKTTQEAQFIKQAMMANEKMGPLLKDMPPSSVNRIVDAAFSISVATGDEIIRQHHLKADNLYVVAAGKFDVFKDGQKVQEVGPGGSFGELALLYRAPRAATVMAASAGKLWAVPRQELREVTQAPLRAKLEAFAKRLDHVDILKDVSKAEKAKLADALVEQTFYEGETIIKQGDEGVTFYIVSEGQVDVEVNGKKVSQVTPASSPNFFGERALLNDDVRAATIKAASAKVKVMALDRESFLRVKQQRKPSKVVEGSSANFVEYSLKKLKRIGLLGCGGFGKVTLEKCEMTGNVFAVKALSKGHIVQQKQENSVLNEATILRMTNSPFLVRVAATFNESQHLYFLLEAASGGELFTIYQRNSFHGKDQYARFYVACVLRAFQHLHQRNIVYRDLKPENLLLDANGYCKVTDFGLAKFVIGHTYTTCGTPDYFAPEMVLGLGHSLAVDWWTFGVLLYELTQGDTPFCDDDVMEIYRKVKQGLQAVTFPDNGGHWVALVKSLLVREPSERLAMRPPGMSTNVEQHPYFSDPQVAWNWAALDARTMTPPYVPTVKSETDLGNFEASEEDAPPEIPYRDPGTGWDAQFEDKRGPKTFD